MLSKKSQSPKATYNSTDMKCTDQTNLWRLKVDQWLLWAEMIRQQGVTANEYAISFWGNANVLDQTVVMDSQPVNIYIKKMNYIL